MELDDSGQYIKLIPSLNGKLYKFNGEVIEYLLLYCSISIPACGANESGRKQLCVLLLENAKEPGLHWRQGVAHSGFGLGHWRSTVPLQHGREVG